MPHFTADYPLDKNLYLKQSLDQELLSLPNPSPSSPTVFDRAYQPVLVYVIPLPPHIHRRRLWYVTACTVFCVTALCLLTELAGSRLQFALEGILKHRQTIHCLDSVRWTHIPGNGDREHSYHAHTSFPLPISANELEFLSEGTLSRGLFTISRTAPPDQTVAVVDLEVSYNHPEALGDAAVCRIYRPGSVWGLGISTTRWAFQPQPEHRMLHFHIHLRLPPTPLALRMNTLTTDLPRFEHRLPEIASSVYFDAIQLTSAHAPIQVESLAGNSIRVRSSDGAIRGTFITPAKIDLETSNGPIDIRATLVNSNLKMTRRLFLKTSNGRIDSDLALVNTDPNIDTDATANFHVAAHTSDAPLHLAFTDAPPESALVVAAHTSNAPARVTLPKTFSGSFSLASNRFYHPSVKVGHGEAAA